MYEDRIKWIEYKGIKILSLDYIGFKNEDFPIMFKEVLRVIDKEPCGSVRYLVNVQNVNFSVKTISLFNKMAEETKKWDKCNAVVGTSGLVKVMYDGFSKIYTKPLKTFNNKEEALEWLANY